MNRESRLSSASSVCVIIPFWNGGKWIERAIQSVVEQTLPPDEFIVVNDGSSPDERKRLEELSHRYDFRILDKENGGQGSARNYGVAASKSDWICFLDQDDFYLPDHIKMLAACLSETSPLPGVVYGSFHLADSSGKVHVENALENTQSGLHPPVKSAVSVYGRNLSILPSAVMIYKSVFLKAGGFDAQFRGYEDDDLFGRLILSGVDFHYVPKAVYVWCQHKGSTTWSSTMSRSRFLFYVKVRRQFVDVSDALPRDLALALEDRFGRYFYKAAVLSRANRDDEQVIDISNFNAFVHDIKSDPVPSIVKFKYLARWFLVAFGDFFPFSLFWRVKYSNRRRVEARKLRSGKSFVK